VAPALVLLAVAAYGLQTDNITLNVDRRGVRRRAVRVVSLVSRRAGAAPASRDLTMYYLMIGKPAARWRPGGTGGAATPGLVLRAGDATLTALLAAVALWRLSVLVPLAALGIAVTCGYYVPPDRDPAGERAWA
jgi:hypothetical protein